MTLGEVTRRSFLQQAGGSLSGVWLAANWPAIVAAAEHAHQAAQSPTPTKFEVFTAEQAVEVEAIASRIIPSGETPGAREAGVVYFIDRALTTFGSDNRKLYEDGLADLQDRVRETFPGVQKFSAATPEQQDATLKAMDAEPAAPKLAFRAPPKEFFEVIRRDTIMGFLIEPGSAGNRDGVGWKLIGREPQHTFQPPFGYYDKDYPGWQPNPKDADKR